MAFLALAAALADSPCCMPSTNHRGGSLLALKARSLPRSSSLEPAAPSRPFLQADCSCLCDSRSTSLPSRNQAHLGCECRPMRAQCCVSFFFELRGLRH